MFFRVNIEISSSRSCRPTAWPAPTVGAWDTGTGTGLACHAGTRSTLVYITGGSDATCLAGTKLAPAFMIGNVVACPAGKRAAAPA